MTFERFFEHELDEAVNGVARLAGRKLEKPERKHLRKHFRAHEGFNRNVRAFYDLLSW